MFVQGFFEYFFENGVVLKVVLFRLLEPLPHFLWGPCEIRFALQRLR